jgi:N-acetyl sugar amidotransferase
MKKIKDLNYQICKLTVMDTSDPEITFDENGISNHALKYINERKIRIISGSEKESRLNDLVKKIKVNGEKKKYDCIIGLSGGTDSTYVAYLSKKLGLRPLAVHLDNGWNSELAVDNIQKTLKTLSIDLYTHVIDWNEFKDLQRSFLYASTPDIEIPTDHAINSLLFEVARKFDIKYILSGYNFNDEGVWPDSWAYGHLDWKYISGIHKKFGKEKLTTYPHTSIFKLLYYVLFLRIKTISILNYIDFEKEEARKLLEKEIGWRNYGGKHNESIYTKFVQDFLLPHKFNIDVRRPYLSAPILQGQLKREEALEILKISSATEDETKEQLDYFCKKMEISNEEFSTILSLPIRNRFDYNSNINLVKFLKKALNVARKIGIAAS